MNIEHLLREASLCQAHQVLVVHEKDYLGFPGKLPQELQGGFGPVVLRR
jgi:hypothetical protein